jgi:hypothetical protein
MVFMHRRLTGAVSALFLFLLNACNTEERLWNFEDHASHYAPYSSKRLILNPESQTSHLEVELVKSHSGLRMYVNLLLFEALPLENQPKRTSLNIILDDGEEMTVYPYLLQGGQRLLLPEEISDLLINQLLCEHSFVISVGNKKTTVVFANFTELYDKL